MKKNTLFTFTTFCYVVLIFSFVPMPSLGQSNDEDIRNIRECSSLRAAPGDEGDRGSCDLEIYSRREYVHHAVEAWEIIKPNVNIDAGGKFGGFGRGFNFSAYSYVTQACERPICKPSACNICEKSHLNKPKRYF